jgi:DNA-binding CsgD family transcriptional regulator
MTVTVSTKEDLVRVLRSLGLEVHEFLAGLPGQLLVLDRRQRTVAEFGRQTLAQRTGPLHEQANLRALQGEQVTYEWDVQKGRQSARLSTVVAPLRNPASRIVGLVVVTRNLSTVDAGNTHDAGAAPQHALSAREQDVLHLLREGYRPRSIAEILHLSPQTVRNHLKAVFRKTGTHSQEELITMARRPLDK